jgi:hypothetical protein
MSWYNRKPRPKTLEKLKPHRASPMSEQVLKIAKEKSNPKTNKKEDKNE